MSKTITETIGVDLGDRYSAYCVIDQATGAETGDGRIRTTPASFKRFFSGRDTSRVVMEVGTHSPRSSRIVAEDCPETLVANARDLRFIFKNQRKSDRVDARALARVGRMDPELLSPIRHRGEQAQFDLALIRARAALVSAAGLGEADINRTFRSEGGHVHVEEHTSEPKWASPYYWANWTLWGLPN